MRLRHLRHLRQFGPLFPQVSQLSQLSLSQVPRTTQQTTLILIAGHTHRPVWSSLSHLDQLTMQLYALRLRQEEMEASKYQEAFQNLLHAIIKRRAKDRTIGDTLKTTPAYFNTGCCRFEDGDITGIEITGKCIGLVKWDRRTLGRVETISMPLAELFALL